MRLNILPVLAGLLLSLPLAAQDAVPSAQDAQNLTNAGRFEEAAKLWKHRADASETDAQAHFMYAYNLHMSGDIDTAHDAHIAAAKFSQYTPTALYNHACVHALRNERDEAFKALEEAVAAGFSNASQLETDSDVKNLRGDGRFEAILLRLEGKTASKLASLPAARRFDFYVGEWSMEKDGEVERYLSVANAYDGKGLRVTSVEADGKASAESLFLYDEKAGKWRQVWMSKEGMVVVMEGGLQEGAMVMQTTTENGKPKTDGRSVFRNIAADGFVYEWQQSEDGGKSWQTVATRAFNRRAAS